MCAAQYKDHIDQILLQRNRGKTKVKKGLRGKLSFMHEGMLSEDVQADQIGDFGPACSHNSVNTYGDTSVSLFERQLEEYRALGEISVDHPMVVIWHNKDFDERKTAIGVFNEPGTDGRLYVQILGEAGGLPFDELEFLPLEVAPTGDPLIDALIEDELEAEAATNKAKIGNAA